jgi:hypothetical protein
MHSDLALSAADPKLQTSLFPAPRRQVRLPATDSPLIIQQIKTWLSDCRDHHPRCKDRVPDPQLPTRVLDLDNAQDGWVRLIEPNGSPGQYVCLSYCWGRLPKDVLFTTTKATYAERTTRIEVSRLPRTLRETVLATVNLGIQYLWIDSICIVQDDRGDWEREAAQMASIYENASLTIAAAAAPDANQGLFTQGNQTVASPQPLARTPVDIYVRKTMPYSLGHIDCGNIENIDQFSIPTARQHSISSRGWCLQERLLSRRIVFFGRHEVAWECSTGSMCYCQKALQPWTQLPADLLRQQALQRSIAGLEQVYTEARLALQASRLGGPHLWHGLVVQFMTLNLTQSNDRLPALSGLAKAFLRGRRDDEYLAGLWCSALIHDLLWCRERKPPIESRHAPNEAPSWSWASCRWGIEYDQSFPGDLKDVILADVMVGDTHCQHPKGDPTGAVENGQVALRGKLAFLKLRKNFSEPALVGKDGRIVTVSTDYELGQVDRKGRMQMWDDDTPVMMLLLATGRNARGLKRELGVVLLREEPSHAYQRAGYFDQTLANKEWSPFDDVSERVVVKIV